MTEKRECRIWNLPQGGETWPLKDAELARRNREDGNAAFQSGNHELAVVLYTESMRYSPVHPTTHEGEDFAAAAANRSAALMALGKFEECLEDVQLAIEAGYTSTASYKLYIRQDLHSGHGIGEKYWPPYKSLAKKNCSKFYGNESLISCLRATISPQEVQVPFATGARRGGAEGLR